MWFIVHKKEDKNMPKTNLLLSLRSEALRKCASDKIKIEFLRGQPE